MAQLGQSHQDDHEPGNVMIAFRIGDAICRTLPRFLWGNAIVPTVDGSMRRIMREWSGMLGKYGGDGQHGKKRRMAKDDGQQAAQTHGTLRGDNGKAHPVAPDRPSVSRGKKEFHTT